MKTITVIIENAVTNHEPDRRVPAQVINAMPESYPVPVPTETSVAEVADDLVMFRLRDSVCGKILIELPIRNYLEVIGTDGTEETMKHLLSVRRSVSLANAAVTAYLRHTSGVTEETE